jgi:hypothetical protein
MCLAAQHSFRFCSNKFVSELNGYLVEWDKRYYKERGWKISVLTEEQISPHT